MRWFFFAMSILLPAGAAHAQEGWPADRLEPSLATGDLLATRTARLVPGRIEVSLGADWAHHLLGRAAPGESTAWIVSHRLSVRAAVAYTPGRSLRLAAGFCGVPLQQGTRTDAAGAAVPLRASMGGSWVAATWAVPDPLVRPLQAAVATSLVLPTAPAAGLAGGEQIEIRMLVLLSGSFWWLRPALNLGVVSRARTRFAELVIDDGLIYRAGIELGPPGWILAATAEIAGEAPLDDPAAGGPQSLLEALVGLKIIGLWGIEIRLGAGFGLMGAGSPACRGLVLARWAAPAEKSDETVE